MPHDEKDERDETGQDATVPGEVYIEYKQVGQAMKVTAIDADTGLEVVIMGPASAAQMHLQKVAVEKLKAQLKKAEGEVEAESEPEPDAGEDTEDETQMPPKGWIV